MARDEEEKDPEGWYELSPEQKVRWTEIAFHARFTKQICQHTGIPIDSPLAAAIHRSSWAYDHPQKTRAAGQAELDQPDEGDFPNSFPEDLLNP